MAAERSSYCPLAELTSSAWPLIAAHFPRFAVAHEPEVLYHLWVKCTLLGAIEDGWTAVSDDDCFFGCLALVLKWLDGSSHRDVAGEPPLLPLRSRLRRERCRSRMNE